MSKCLSKTLQRDLSFASVAFRREKTLKTECQADILTHAFGQETFPRSTLFPDKRRKGEHRKMDKFRPVQVLGGNGPGSACSFLVDEGGKLLRSDHWGLT